MINGINSRSLEDRYIAKTYQKLEINVAKAKGSLLWDQEGKKYIDLMSGYGVAILGHSNPAITDAIKAQLDSVIITHGSMYTPSRGEFLRKFMSVAPSRDGQIYMSNSGTEAVEAALKIAIRATGRKKIIAMERGYHGKTLGSLSLTHSEKYKKGLEGLIYPNVEFLPFGDADIIEGRKDLDDIAAIFVEPVQGEGGIFLPPDDYLKRIRQITSDHGILLMADEIQTGLGRTGKLWAFENWNIVPDIFTAGKGIGGGIPMGVTWARQEYMEKLSVGSQTSTMGGNPLACAAGTAVLDQLTDTMLDRVRSAGEKFRQELQTGIGDHRLVKDVRGIGLMLAIELKVRFVDILLRIIQNGAVPLYSGINIIRLLPPYVIEDSQISEAVSIIAGALENEKNQREASP